MTNAIPGESAKPEIAPGETSVPKPKRGPKGKVIIFGTWCKGCGICVAFCPTGVLELNADSHPIVAYPEKCTACHWCDTHCPDMAIIIKPLEA